MLLAEEAGGDESMRVLLADDQVWLRSALRLLLEQERNIEVVGEAIDAQALLAAAGQLHPDLILLDWELPGLKTNEARLRLMAALRALHPRLYIVALSGSDNMQSAWLFMGADACVSKAEPPEHLLAALQAAQRRTDVPFRAGCANHTRE